MSKEIIQAIKQLQYRLPWDEYFMSMAYLASQRSTCQRLKVGCVIIKDRRLICMGYNGFLPNSPHISLVRDKHEQATVHAEQNAVGDAACRGTALCDATAYVTHYPCINCFKILVASGIKHIIYSENYNNDKFVENLAIKNGVKVTKYKY